MKPVRTPVQPRGKKDADLQVGSSLARPKQRGRRSIAPKDRDAFLEALSNGWTVRDAVKAAGGRHHSTWYELRKSDPDFASAWDEAWELGTQALEQEAFRRGVEGYDEVTYDGDGKETRRVRRYDSALLQRLLVGRRPNVYGSNPQAVAIAASTADPEPLRHQAGLTIGDLIKFAVDRRIKLGENVGAGSPPAEIGAGSTPLEPVTIGQMINKAFEIQEATGQDFTAQPLALPPGDDSSEDIA